MSTTDQPLLIDVPPDWRKLWDGMPEFRQENCRPFDSINVQFRNAEDKIAFLKLLGEKPDRIKSIWYPRMEYLRMSDPYSGPTKTERNNYPIYIISKGRWKTQLTAKALDKLCISYKVVIEPQEEPQYAKVIGSERLLLLPFSNLGQGSIPARNWVWEHSISLGVSRHWILDDNLDGFYELNNNEKKAVRSFNPFHAIEQFADRFTNVALAGMQYEFFASRRDAHPPFIMNTRIYSCILIQNGIPFRWRGRYNEDTDLSLRALKDGWCTVLFNHVLAKKMPTMTMEGGNTDELYKGDGRLAMAQSLRHQHPDVVTVTQKWGRWQHLVNYEPFKMNKLRHKAEQKHTLTPHPEPA